MILDSSAVVAILFREAGFERLLEALSEAPTVSVGAATLVETGIVVSARLRGDGRGLLARFVQECGVATVPFTEAHFASAVEAWLRFGKGRHPAALNFGDCLSYALAKVAGEPLLCVGNDFALTDIRLA